MVRAFPVILLAAALCCGDSLDEAARNLARKLSARLTPGETPRVTGRNLSTLGSHDFMKARASFERSLRHNRAAQAVEVVFTISQNAREYLLVAELRRPPERIVEIVPYRPEPLAQAAKVVLDRRLLWEQPDPILDLAVVDDRMVVLEPAYLKLYTRRGSLWELQDSKPLSPATAVRDPRGRLQIADASLTAYLPGSTCRGSWIPALDLNCEAADAEFPLSGESVKLIAGRNALASPGWPLFFSYGRIAEQPRPLFLLAEMDGRTHLYDAERRPAGVFDAWGSDFAVVETGCGAARDILVTSSADRDANDSVADFEVVDRKPLESSDPLEFPGPITALWPATDGAVAIAHNANLGRYAAYSIAITCSH